MAWVQKSTGLAGLALNVHCIAIEWGTMGTGLSSLAAWACTDDGLYKTIGFDSWSGVALPEPELAAGEPDTIVAVTCPKAGTGIAYVTAYDTVSGKAWLYKTVNGGTDWTWIQIVTTDTIRVAVFNNFKIIEKVGDVGGWSNLGSPIWPVSGGLYRSDDYLYLAARLKGLYRYSAGWNNIMGDITTEYFFVGARDNGNLLVVDDAVPSLIECSPAGVVVQTLNASRPPDIGGKPYLFCYAIEHETNLYLMAICVSGGTEYIKIWRRNPSGFVLELDTSVTARTWTTHNMEYNCMVEQGETIWCIRNNTVMYRNLVGTWSTDSFSCLYTIYDLHVVNDELYAGTSNGIYKRNDDVGNWEAIATGKAAYYLTWAGKWYIVTNDNWVWSWSGSAWVFEVDHSGHYISANPAYPFERKNMITGYGGVGVSPEPPTTGRAHIMDVDINEGFVYVCLLHTSGWPVVFKIDTGLTVVENVHSALVGTWGGVMCSLSDPATVFAFGDFGYLEKISISEDSGSTWTNITPASFDIAEVVSVLLQDNWDPNDIIALLNVAGDAWRSTDEGENFEKRSDTPVSAECGARSFLTRKTIWAGDETAGDPELVKSEDTASTWGTDQPTTSYGTNVVRTAVIGSV